jgi:protein phosphatase
VKLIKQTNKEVNKLTQSYVTNIVLGTTLVCCYVSKDDLYIANIGDSRCYILEDKNLTQISEDQTYTNYLYKAGKITKEELETHPQKHVLTNALGTYPSVMVQTYHLKKIPQIILLCSDGLYNMVNNFEISEVLNSSLSLKEKGELLIKKANENGGKDNIAVALWEGNQYENR